MEVHFHLGGPDKAYALQLLGPVTGDLKNALSEFQQQAFSTQDRDQDLQSDVNCAKLLSGEQDNLEKINNSGIITV